jgi:2,3-bisphosphoglycerate-dependent phosphoglycerate mutase
MAKLYIIRHGETSDNKQKIFSGWRDTELDEDGIAEAKRLGEVLKDVPFTKAYCSDLARSRHTAELVLEKYHPSVQLISDWRIKERDYGDLTGTSKIECQEKDPENYALWHRSWETPPPHGESVADVEKRVMPFLHELLSSIKPDDVVLLSMHGNSMRPVRKYFEHMSEEQAASFEHTPGEYFEYEV